MKILIYALGGGWGHLTRAAALANALGLEQVRILANSPYLGIVQTAMPGLAVELVPAREDVASCIVRDAPDVLVVDTFPRGLAGELVDLLPAMKAVKVLIHRDINPEYTAWANLHRFVAEHYDCVLCPGERGPLADLPQARFTAPWLIRPPIDVGAMVDVVVCAAGRREEMPWYGEVAALLARELNVRCLASELPPACPRERWIRYWPSIDWIANARVVVGGAGYNTINECAALSVPLIARPWPRKYDRQRLRAGQSPAAIIVETPQQAVSAAVNELARDRQPRPAFSNGAHQAAEWIRERVHSAPSARD